MPHICEKMVGNSILIAQRLQNFSRNNIIERLLVDFLPFIVMVLISNRKVNSRSGKCIIQQDNQMVIYQEE